MNVRIKVIRVDFHPDLAEKYLEEGQAAGACPYHTPGQEFVYTGSAKPPKGICPWAWLDFGRSIMSIASGANHQPWNNKKGQTILCCTDGIRPVTFEVTAFEEK